MSDIWVKAVDKKGQWVKIQAMNVEFTFIFNKGGLKIISKCKPSAHVYDSAACWVPTYLFNNACSQAAAILLKKSEEK